MLLSSDRSGHGFYKLCQGFVIFDSDVRMSVHSFVTCNFAGEGFSTPMKSVLGTGVFNSDGVWPSCTPHHLGRKVLTPHCIAGDMWKSVCK